MFASRKTQFLIVAAIAALVPAAALAADGTFDPGRAVRCILLAMFTRTAGDLALQPTTA